MKLHIWISQFILLSVIHQIASVQVYIGSITGTSNSSC